MGRVTCDAVTKEKLTNTHCLFSFHRELDSEVVCCPQQMRLSLAFRSYCRPNRIFQCTFQNKIKIKIKNGLKISLFPLSLSLSLVLFFHCLPVGAVFFKCSLSAMDFPFLLSRGLFFSSRFFAFAFFFLVNQIYFFFFFFFLRGNYFFYAIFFVRFKCLQFSILYILSSLGCRFIHVQLLTRFHWKNAKDNKNI